MSHSPPVPPGNQSPFPRHEPPHPHAAEPTVTRAPQDAPPARTASPLGLAAVIGVGAIAALVGALFLRAEAAKAKPRARKGGGKRG